MLGLTDPWIIAAYLGSICATLLCVVYGAWNWNRGNENEIAEIAEEARWEEDDIQLDETL